MLWMVVVVGVIILATLAATLGQRTHARHESMRHHPTNGFYLAEPPQ